MRNRYISSAARYLQKEIERLRKTVTEETIRESIAKENKESALKRIEELESQIEMLEPKTAFASL